jgi:4-amino-4-deoxy-L-arabinose transferase-like glycosyltransferase
MSESLKQVYVVDEANWLRSGLLQLANAIKYAVAAHKAETLCACLLLLLAVNLFAAIARKSITNDETVLIPSAYYHWVTNDFQLIREHPPFCKLLAGLPLLFIQPNELPPEKIDPRATSDERDWAHAMSFWEDNRPLFQSISFWSRVPMIVLTIALGLLIFVFARDLFGARAAVLAVALFALEPTVLAHGRVVQTDVPAMFGFLLVFFTLHRYLKARTWRRAGWIGIASGIALLSKFSMLLIGPILVGVFVWVLWRTPRRRSLVGHALIVTLATLLVINAAYFFHSRALTPADSQWVATTYPSSAKAVTTSIRVLSYVVPTDFLLGIYWQLWHSTQGHEAGLLGKYSKKGWWYYFPIAFALKTTVPFLLLSIAALCWGTYQLFSKRDWRFLILLAPFVLYTLFVMKSTINIGVRYYLPAYAFLFILGGALLDRILNLRRARVAGFLVAIAILGWCGIEAVRAFPNYMPYMNQLASGRPHWWYLSDSNVEWGDDVNGLADFLHARGEHRVRAMLLGGFITLKFYDVEYVDAMARPGDSPPRYTAIGASFLNGATVPFSETDGVITNEQRVNKFAEYRNRTPEAVIGNSIYVFREP